MKCDMQDFIGHHIGVIARNLKNLLTASSKYSNLSFAQCASLFIIDEHSNVSINFIAKELEKDKATISREIDVLLKRGLCVKNTNAKDKRSVHLKLTQNGKAQLESVKKYLTDIDKLLRKAFSDDEIALFMSLLERLKDRIKEIDVNNEIVKMENAFTS